MDFIKKHYEKILLGAVLLGLTVALAYLPFKISGDRQASEEQVAAIVNVTPKELNALNLTTNTAGLQRVQTPAALNLAGEHNLFNPVPWQKRSDDRLVKVSNTEQIGPKALVVTKITPLNLIVTFDSTNSSGGYLIKTEREAEIRASKRTSSHYFSQSQPKFDNLLLREVKDGGARLEFEMTDTGEKFSVVAGKPFKRVDGYTIDLKYPPENLPWSGRREGNTIRFAGDEFTIKSIKEIAPGEYEIVLSARSTEKKHTINYKP